MRRPLRRNGHELTVERLIEIALIDDVGADNDREDNAYADTDKGFVQLMFVVEAAGAAW